MTNEIRATWFGHRRQTGLRRFGIAITLLNILGHTVLGFEQAWAMPFVAVAAAYAAELLLEGVDAAAQRRPPRWRGGVATLVDFLLPAHISGLAVGMLLYTNSRPAAVACAAVLAIVSKSVIRVWNNGVPRHVFNPSNFGITATLLLFPWVGIAPPYQFTENLDGIGDWLLPSLIVASGTLLNVKFTRRVPLILAWLVGFALQAAVRATVADAPLLEVLRPALAPITGVAFLLFTFYMVTDPATTPSSVKGQIAFGLAVAGVYGVLTASHIVFGLFFALTAVCGVRAVTGPIAGLVPQRATTQRQTATFAGRVWPRSRLARASQEQRGSSAVS